MRTLAFNHEKLNVYQRTLRFNARVSDCVAEWDHKHAICDHLPRAAESMLDNIATASAAYSAMKLRCLDYATGSTLECAACLDLARLKGLLSSASADLDKEELSQLLKMLIGLRRSWSPSSVREDHAEYGPAMEDAEDAGAPEKAFRAKVFFHHERLDVYRVALQVAEGFVSSKALQNLSAPAFRKLDSLLTSMILNIAEGNGRFSTADQRRFLGGSHEAAIKLAAKLDLYELQGLLPSDHVKDWKVFLLRVSTMTASMA